MTNEELDEIEARANAATPGPWKHADSRDNEVRLEHGGFPASGYSHWSMMRPNDATFIAAARQDVPRLIQEVRRLQKDNDK